MAFLAEFCSIKVLTRDLLASCKTFRCGDKDLDEFFLEDAVLHHNALLGKSYCLMAHVQNPVFEKLKKLSYLS